MEQAIFKYYDSAGTPHSETINVLSVRGFDEPDEVKLIPSTKYEFADGSLGTVFKAFQRIVTIVTQPITDPAIERFLQLFLSANLKSVTYQGDEVSAEEVYVVN